MKSFKDYINESKVDINKYYVNVLDLKDDANIILGWIDEDGDAYPYNVIVKKHNDDVVFVNPDDDRDILAWNAFINIEDKNNPKVAVFKNIKEAEKVCNYYNETK